MRPELFCIPWIHLSIPSYGAMMVVGFLAALALARWRSRRLGEDPNHITDFGVYALLAGVLGARGLHVIHNWGEYRHNLGQVFAVWSGGLEFLGGVLVAMVAFAWYFRRRKLPMLKYLDILAPALMLGLAFGRIGCFLNGCCFGAVCDLPWGMRFPAVVKAARPGCHGDDANGAQRYGYPYEYQLHRDTSRHGEKKTPIELPPEYYGYADGEGRWYDDPGRIPPDPAGARREYYRTLKPPAELSSQQRREMAQGRYRMKNIHPAQAYSFANAVVLCVVLNALFRWRKREGQVFGVMLVLYGVTRFGLEMVRTEPVVFAGMTISQHLGIVAAIAGIVLLVLRPGRVVASTVRGK